jgi:hypothetical protein
MLTNRAKAPQGVSAVMKPHLLMFAMLAAITFLKNQSVMESITGARVLHTSVLFCCRFVRVGISFFRARVQDLLMSRVVLRLYGVTAARFRSVVFKPRNAVL